MVRSFSCGTLALIITNLFSKIILKRVNVLRLLSVLLKIAKFWNKRQSNFS